MPPDLTVLPGNSPTQLLSPPTASAPAFIALSIALSFLFFLSFTLISFRHKMGAKMTMILDKPLLQRMSAWIGFFGFLIGELSHFNTTLGDVIIVIAGITSFLVIRMWFEKAVQDFNASIAAQGQQGPKLLASTGNAFTSEYTVVDNPWPLHSYLPLSSDLGGVRFLCYSNHYLFGEA